MDFHQNQSLIASPFANLFHSFGEHLNYLKYRTARRFQRKMFEHESFGWMGGSLPMNVAFQSKTIDLPEEAEAARNVPGGGIAVQEHIGR
jgi:hypothetical protein